MGVDSQNIFGGSSLDEISTAQQTSDGGYILGGRSASAPSGNKTSPQFGGDDLWVVKLASREVPVGTPLVLVNGQYNPSNSYTVTATLALIEIQSSFTSAHIFYTLDGSAPSSIPRLIAVPCRSTTPLQCVLSPTIRTSRLRRKRAVSVSITPVSFFLSNVGNGTIVSEPNTNLFEFGQQVTLTAAPRVSWWQFVRWSDGNTTNPRVITVGANNSFTAIFTNSVPVEMRIYELWQRDFGGTNSDNMYGSSNQRWRLHPRWSIGVGTGR